MKNKVLIIDADLENCKQIKYSLINTDTDVFYVHSVSEGLRKIQSTLYSLIILDILLSQDVDIEMLRKIKMLNDCSLLVLSEQASSVERVMALKLGADDVLTKPYDLEECLARAQTLIRHFTERNPIIGRRYAVVGFPDLLLDTAKRMVYIAGNEIVLTRKEYEILLYLFTNRNLVLSYGQIYEAAWSEDYLWDRGAISFHIRQLRKKLCNCVDIQSVRGVGYRLKLNSQ